MTMDMNGPGPGPDNEKNVSDQDLSKLLEDTKRELDREKREKAAAQAEVATERTQRVAAETRAAKATTGQVNEWEQRLTAEERAVENAITAAKNEADGYEAQIANLQADGKWQEAAQVQRKMAQAEARVLQGEQQRTYFKNARSEYERRVEAAKNAPRPEPQQEQQQDPLAAYSPQTKAWLKGRPQFLTDRRYHAKVMSAHHAAEGEGIEPDTQDYFDFIETHIGERRAEAGNGHDTEEDDIEQPEAPPARRPVSTTAPVRRTASPTPGSTPKGTIKLSAEQREAADISMAHIADPAERYTRYSDNLKALKASGRLN